ncbi:MAG: DUF5915 domain-containing protein, partial [Actinomycetota bacterium]
VVPNFRALGPKLGKDVPAVQAALKAGDFAREGDEIVVLGHRLGPDEVELRTRPREGFAVADEGGLAVAVDTELDEALEDEGIARELVHFIQGRRKDTGLEVADRIRLEIAGDERLRRVLERHGDEIASETLCTDLTVADDTAGEAFAADGCTGAVRLERA